MEQEIVKIKSRWWEIWKPLEKVIVINDCEHKWNEINREQIKKATWGDDKCIGSLILLKCTECGDLRKVKMSEYDNS